MIRHIVAFRLATADPDARRRQAAEIRERLTSLVGQIPGLLALDVFEDVGVVPSHWPLILISDFETPEALDRYMVDPRHRAVVEWMNNGIVVDRAAVDYDVR